MFKADGTPNGNSLCLPSDVDILGRGIRLAPVPDGGFVAVWTAASNGGSEGSPHLARYTSSNQRVWVHE